MPSWFSTRIGHEEVAVAIDAGGAVPVTGCSLDVVVH
jgi:hypothetical protein